MDALTEGEFLTLQAFEMKIVCSKDELIKERRPDFDALAEKGLIEPIWVLSDNGRKAIIEHERK